MGSIVGRDVRVPHAAAVDTQSCAATRGCAPRYSWGKKTVSRLDLSRTVRHPAQRIPLALGRPQILAQLSASVRPGEVLPRLNAGRFAFPGKGRPAPTKPNKTETEFRKILV